MFRPSAWKTAACVWALVVVAVCVKPLFKPVSGTIYVTYAVAGHEFEAGNRLYDVPHPHTDNFRYSPVVAAGFVPFSWLPLGAGGALWRAASIAVFLTGLGAWARGTFPHVSRGWFLLATLPLSLQSLHNGQANTLVIGLMLWSAVLAARDRWALAAVFVGAAALFKGYPLALGGLFVLLAPVRFGVPLLATVAAGLALPYALQSPEYVTGQYTFWVENLARDDRTALPLYAGHQDFHMLLRLVGAEVPRDPYRLVQAGTGLAAAALVLWLRRAGADRARCAAGAFTAGVCWMIVFGPVVETATFVLFAPVLARELCDPVGRPRWARASAWAGAGLFAVAIVAFMFPHAVHRPVIARGVQPLGALLVALAASARVWAARAAVPLAPEVPAAPEVPGAPAPRPVRLDRAA